jgi:acyl-CoA dehydrogenase
MDFAYSPKTKELQAKVSAFMKEHVVPAEAGFHAEVAANRAAGDP